MGAQRHRETKTRRGGMAMKAQATEIKLVRWTGMRRSWVARLALRVEGVWLALAWTTRREPLSAGRVYEPRSAAWGRAWRRWTV